jgi:hypothetical protein
VFDYSTRIPDGDREEGTGHSTGHVSLFFIVAPEPGSKGKTLAIWDADAEAVLRQKREGRPGTKPFQAKEGYSGIQYHLYKHLQGSTGDRLAAWYVGGHGNEGRWDCGPLAVDTLLWWVRGQAGELSDKNLGEMGERRLAK